MIKSIFLIVVLLNLAASFTHAEESCSPIAGAEDFYTQGWGYSKSNERFQSRTTINRSNVDQLALKWVYALEGGMSPHSYPVVTRDTIFVGTQAGKLLALERATGCVRWTYDAGDDIRTAVTHGFLSTKNNTLNIRSQGNNSNSNSVDNKVGDQVSNEQSKAYLFFGTSNGRTHAVDATTGDPAWVTDVRDHSMGMLTGAPLFHEGRVFVPVSSSEVVFGVLPWYGCCTFRGSLVALDARSGEIDWRTHMVKEKPAVTGTHYFFVQRYGPSGAPIWSSPTIDAQNGLIFVGTGENYSTPASEMSDSIVAMDIATGKVKWAQQYLANDAFNVGCAVPGHPNCPEEKGPDLDFGAPPILTHTPNGNDIMLAGQKSGGVYALNPKTGERIWERYFGRGGLLGGVHWGMAVNADKGLLFAPINDMQLFYAIAEGVSKPGLHALDIATGELRWTTSMEGSCGERSPCNSGLSAAIAATADLVFAGGLDGFLRAYDADTGAIVWRFDTWGDFEATKGGQATGGTIDVHGPMIADNMMFIQSGYASQSLRGGNALLAFELKESE